MDEVATQNISNSPTTICKKSKNICKKSKKNIMVQNPDKFSRTGVGLQAINGKSLIRFPPNSRTKEIMKFFIESRLLNSQYEQNISKLSDILKLESWTIKKFIFS
ncbi:MAG: hypothetical protein LBT66_01065 [Methanobrevibacter sp.]|jgi:hypothetical protein|nr:hypothetical protein [Candidatus Methanovirga meridionalis]